MNLNILFLGTKGLRALTNPPPPSLGNSWINSASVKLDWVSFIITFTFKFADPPPPGKVNFSVYFYCIETKFICGISGLLSFFRATNPIRLFWSMGLVALKKENHPLMPQMKFGFNTIQIDWEFYLSGWRRICKFKGRCDNKANSVQFNWSWDWAWQ